MIPCIFKPNLLLKAGKSKTWTSLFCINTKLCKKGIKRNNRVLHYALCSYSTTQPLSNIPQNQEKSEESHFWEISEKETKTSKKSSSDARDFQDLLGSLFDDALNAREHFVPSRVEPPQKKNKSEESAIEKKLLELVQRRVYKSKSPLPKSISGSFHYNEEKEQLEKNEGSILDVVEPFDYNWYKEKVMNDERIRAKEKELQIKNAIIESKSVYELLDIINSEINQVSYPDYYSKIIKSAIEYTAKKDPYLTLSIFEQIKAKSIQSYISGCTTGTYNAILLLRWETWRDVYGMLDLLEEMALNGIRVNNETRNIVRMVVTAVEQEEGIESDNRQGLFWNADEKRVCNIMKEMANKWLIKK